jgi:hypothetical protein
MEQLNWRDDDWRDTFFSNFLFDLRFCDSEHLERSHQNIEEYNSTRQRCQGVFNYYLPRVNRIVNEMVNTETPREIVQNIINRLEDIIRDHIFEGIVDQTTEDELQVTNPMLQGNNQEWSESSLVNHYNTIYRYYIRVIVYLNRNVEGGGRKKYKKSRKANKSRRVKKKTRRIRKQKSRKLKK